MAAQTRNNNNSSTIKQGLGGLGSGNSDHTAIGERRRQIQVLEDGHCQEGFLGSTAVASSQGGCPTLSNNGTIL